MALNPNVLVTAIKLISEILRLVFLAERVIAFLIKLRLVSLILGIIIPQIARFLQIDYLNHQENYYLPHLPHLLIL